MERSTGCGLSCFPMAGAGQPAMRRPHRRDQLMSEVGELSSSDDAAAWAYKSLRDKNKLTAADAVAVEKAFQARLGPGHRGPIRSD